MRHLNMVNKLTIYISEIYFNSTRPSRLWCPKWHLSMGFLNQNCLQPCMLF